MDPEICYLVRGSPFGRHEPERLELDAGASLAALGFRVGQRDLCPLPAPTPYLFGVDFAAEGGAISFPLLQRGGVVLPNLLGCLAFWPKEVLGGDGGLDELLA